MQINDLSPEIINRRLAQLSMVLKYDSDTLTPKIFTDWERMQINQERGSLYEVRSHLRGECDNPRTFEVSERVEQKISNLCQSHDFRRWMKYQNDDSLE